MMAIDDLAKEYGWERYGDSYIFKTRDNDFIIGADLKVYIDFIQRTITLKKILSDAEKKQLIKLFGEKY